MAVHIYYNRFDTPLPAAIFNELLAQLPSSLQLKVLLYHRWQDAHACLLGKLLLLEAMHRQQQHCTLDELQYTPYQRPYLPGKPDFNISHSGALVACAISNTGRIGLDIEQTVPGVHHDLQEQFSANEWSNIITHPHPKAAFYYYWTRKEAMLKATGCGITYSLPALDTHGSDHIMLDDTTWHLHTIPFFEGYAAHLASDIDLTAPQLIEVKFPE